MLSVILDFKTDGLDTKNCNLLAISYVLVQNSTNEAISSLSHLIIPQHAIENHDVIPAPEGTLHLGWDIETAKELITSILAREDVTHIIVADLDFDLGILSNKLGINIANKVFIDLNTDTPTLNSKSEKTAVNKDTCLDMLNHINSMYNTVKEHDIYTLVQMKNQPKRLYSIYIDKNDTETQNFYVDLGFTYNNYYGKYVAWLREPQYQKLINWLSGGDLDRDLITFKEQHKKYISGE